MFKGGKKNFRNTLQNKQLEKTNRQKIKFQNFVKGLKTGETGSINRNHSSGECSIGKLMNTISGMYYYIRVSRTISASPSLSRDSDSPSLVLALTFLIRPEWPDYVKDFAKPFSDAEKKFGSNYRRIWN